MPDGGRMVDYEHPERQMKEILVIGDVIADVYNECIFKKMCPDAPSAMALVIDKVRTSPGGAANVAVNLAALAPDCKVTLIGDLSYELSRTIKRLSKNLVNMDFCSISDDPLRKERVLFDGSLVVRVDNRLSVPEWTSSQIEYGLIEYLGNHDPDLIVVSDYAGQSINSTSWKILLDYRERLLVDTKITDLSFFAEHGRRTKLIKLNTDEWRNVIQTEAVPEQFFDVMIVTRGGAGSKLIMQEKLSERSTVTNSYDVLGFDVPAVDVCGCGDTFIAGLAASLSQQSDYYTAMQFANAAAATVVTKPGTAVASLEETIELLKG